MDSLLYSRYLPKLSFVHATSQAQVLGYLSLLQARHYAQGTVDTGRHEHEKVLPQCA